MIRASLASTPPGPARESELALVTDLIWAHCGPGHGLEHLRAKVTGEGLDLYLFMRAPSEAASFAQAHAILTSALPPLISHGYRTTATYC
ncbi:hypothetical protein ACFXA3_32410 [Streptomyces sp. NPDC059456]|uniref:hypothetical protein n=1 Tax=Streptomyces sp. NPDC059456 TaxID=3346838 RepID=UPI003687B0E6